jgi:hypothetical protein
MPERLRAGGRIALLVLAVMLPFEMRDPLAKIGPLELSSVELFLYLTLAIWGASLVADGLVHRRSVGSLGRKLRSLPAAHRAVLAFALVMLVSATSASAPRGPGLKFALRSAGGMLLFAAAADLLRAPRAVARTATALVVGGFVAALLAIAEVRAPSLVGFLRLFHPQTFEALGQARASGPLQYPNIAAMYLEAVTPVAVGLGLAGALRGAQAVVIFVLLAALQATGSRAGLVSAVAAVLLLGALGLRVSSRRRSAWAILAAAAAVVVLASASGMAGRFRFWHDGDWYRAVIVQSGGAAGRLPPVLAPDSTATEIIEVQNLGALAWRRDPPTPVVLSYHWLDAATGQLVTFDGRRTSFPTDIYTGGRARVSAELHAPARPGRYVLWWDLVQEHIAWFSERGNPGLREEVVVRGEASPSPGSPSREASPPPFVRKTLPRRTLWSAAWRMFRQHPLLGIGPDNFRHRYGAFLGLAPREVDERLHANSLYFETLADLGAAGLVAFAFVLVALAAAARRAAAPAARRFLALGLACALGTYLLHGALDYFLEFTPTYALFWLLGGAIVAMDRSREVSP